MKRFRYWWDWLIHTGADHLAEHDPRRKICIGINKMSVSVILINATLGISSYFFTGNLPLLLGVIVEIFAMTLPLFLNYKKKYWWASMTLYVLLSGATFYFCCKLGKLA